MVDHHSGELKYFDVIMDTGSHLTWLPSKAAEYSDGCVYRKGLTGNLRKTGKMLRKNLEASSQRGKFNSAPTSSYIQKSPEVVSVCLSQDYRRASAT